MTAAFPPDAGWWEALFFRLAGPDNAVVRALIAGNPNLPAAAFDILARDPEWEVLATLCGNTASPDHVILKVLRHPDAQEFLTDEWYDDAPGTYSFLSADDLLAIIPHAGQWGLRAALRHQNADERVIDEALSLVDDTERSDALDELLDRLPHEQHPKLWRHIAADSPHALLDCPTTPTPLLLQIAHDIHLEMCSVSSWNYQHGPTEMLCRHPNASAEIFDLLMQHEVFQDRESEEDFPCLRAIGEHPHATPSQREEAANLHLAAILSKTTDD